MVAAAPKRVVAPACECFGRASCSRVPAPAVGKHAFLDRHCDGSCGVTPGLFPRPPTRLPRTAAEGEISSTVSAWLNPPKEELPDDFEMPIWDHLDELRERVLVGRRHERQPGKPECRSVLSSASLYRERSKETTAMHTGAAAGTCAQDRQAGQARRKRLPRPPASLPTPAHRAPTA